MLGELTTLIFIFTNIINLYLVILNIDLISFAQKLCLENFKYYLFNSLFRHVFDYKISCSKESLNIIIGVD